MQYPLVLTRLFFCVGGCYDLILKSLFSHFSRNKQTGNLKTIPWNEVVKECYDKNLNFIHPVTKVIYTDEKTVRAVILQRPDMSYTIAFEKLYSFIDNELKYLNNGDLHGYWSSSNSSRSIFDTEERAVNEVFSTPPFKYNKCLIG
jgi:hypothetical protein